MLRYALSSALRLIRLVNENYFKTPPSHSLLFRFSLSTHTSHHGVSPGFGHAPHLPITQRPLPELLLYNHRPCEGRTFTHNNHSNVPTIHFFTPPQWHHLRHFRRLSGKQRPSFSQTDTPFFPKAPNYIPRGFPNEVKALHHNHDTPHTSILSSIAVHHTIPPIQYTARITHTQHQFTQQPPKDSFRILTIDSQRYLDNPSQS